MSALLAPSRRLRRTPFTSLVESAGVKAYTAYNRMRLPSVFETVEADYHHLKAHVQIWDVAAERQVEIIGPDAAHLAQLLTPRDLRKISVGQCAYVPICDQSGGMLNDPVLLKLAENRFWFSLADSDLGLWIKGIAVALKLDVRVFEPDTSPLAVQGPKSGALMARLFGDDICNLPFFRFAHFKWSGIDWLIARSGWSKQGGFEIYVEGTERGPAIWSALFEAGKDLNARAGCPNAIERIESGLLSYGNDMTDQDTPFHCGLDRFCQLETVKDCIGWKALFDLSIAGVTRRLSPVEIAGDPVPVCDMLWPVYTRNGTPAGNITSATWSPDFSTNVAIAMLNKEHWKAETKLITDTPNGQCNVIVRETFWN